MVPNEREELPGITGGGEEVLLGAWDDELGMILFSYIFIIFHRKIDIYKGWGFKKYQTNISQVSLPPMQLQPFWGGLFYPETGNCGCHSLVLDDL